MPLQTQEEINSLIANVKTELNELPANEFTYYMAMLLVSIQSEAQPGKNRHVLEKTLPLIQNIKQFYNDPENLEQNIIQVTHAVNELINASATSTLSRKSKNALLKLCGAVLAMVTGITFGMAGLTAGLFLQNSLIVNVKGAGLGLLSGFTIGALIGYRSPTKLFCSSLDIKLSFCIDSITRLRDELKDRKTQEEYQIETKKYILDTFFVNVPEELKEAAFTEYLTKDQEFQICTNSAGHISASLKGHLGHHSLIRFKINGIKDIPIEFGDRIKTPNHVDQFEKPRKVSGQILFEMLTLDRMLQDTHKSTIKNAIRLYDIGSDDCRTYVDKILIGTGQEPTKIGRFSHQNDTFIGRKLVAPVIGFFSKTNEKDLHRLIDNPEDEKFNITHCKYMGRTEW